MALSLGPRALAAGTRLAYFDSVGSTNTEAQMAARAGERGPIWFATTEQIAGKGRRDRSWIAPRGNLCASVLNVMDITPASAANLGFVAGLSVVHALDDLVPQAHDRIALKWPNDCLADGKKFVGIDVHAESIAPHALAVVAGIGINLIAAPQGTPTPATSLADCGLKLDAGQMLAALSDAWAANFALWDAGRGFASLRQEWLARAARLGDTISIVNGAHSLVGTFETIDEQGCLVLQTQNGERHTVTAGDVFFGDARSKGAA